MRAIGSCKPVGRLASLSRLLVAVGFPSLRRRCGRLKAILGRMAIRLSVSQTADVPGFEHLGRFRAR